MEAKNATKRDSAKRNKEGKCLDQGFFALKWKNCAHAIKKAINSAGINTNTGNHIPVTNKVAKVIFDAPTMFLVKSDKPYCLNSLTMLSSLKIQT